MVRYHKKAAAKDNRYQNQQRELIRQTFEDMSYANWRRIDASIRGDPDFARYPSRALELEAANHILRRGLPPARLRQERPHLSKNPSELMFRLLRRLSHSPDFMAAIGRTRAELDSIPAITPASCRQSLAHLPEANREYMLSFIPPNTLLSDEKRFRDRDLIRRYFSTDSSTRELASAYGLSNPVVRATVTSLVDFLCKRPLVREEVRRYRDVVEKIPTMEAPEVADRLEGIRGQEGGRAKIEEIVQAVPIISWTGKRDSAREHRWIAIRYFGGEKMFPKGFAEAYGAEFAAEFKGETLRRPVVDTAARGIVSKMDAVVCDLIRFHAGEIPQRLFQVAPLPEVDPIRMEPGHEFACGPQPPPQAVAAEPAITVTVPAEIEAGATPTPAPPPPAHAVEQPPQPKEPETPPEPAPPTPPPVAEQLPPPKEPPARVEPEPPKEPPHAPIPEPPREPAQVVEPEPPPEPTVVEAPVQPLPDAPALSAEQFNAVLVRYQGTQKRRDMLAAANLEPLKGPSAQRDNELGRRVDAGARAAGDNIFPFMSFIRTGEDAGLFVGILGHFEEACTGWMERLMGDDNPLTVEDIPRIALYSVLATDDRVRNDMSDLHPALGERHQEVGRGYQELIAGLREHESLRGRYSNTERFFRQRIQELYRSQ